MSLIFENHGFENIAFKRFFFLAGDHALFGNGQAGETGKKKVNLKGDTFINGLAAGEVAEECTPPRNAWVSCDDCHKWRRIPAGLADKIEETNCIW